MARGLKMPKRIGTRPELQPMAKLIRDAMRTKQLDVGGLTEAMGMTKDQRGAVANWVSGVNGPGDSYRPKLAEALGIEETLLVNPFRGPGGRPGKSATRPERDAGPAQRAVAARAAALNGSSPPSQILPPAPPVSDVFTIRARSDGTMLIKLDASLPFGRGSQLVQFLLGFGLVIAADTAETGTGTDMGTRDANG